MIKRLDSSSTTASRASASSSYSANSNNSRKSFTSASSATTVDPALIPAPYHRPAVFKAVDTQEDNAHNASINRHLLVSSPKHGKDEKSGLKVKGMLWALTAARV